MAAVRARWFLPAATLIVLVGCTASGPATNGGATTGTGQPSTVPTARTTPTSSPVAWPSSSPLPSPAATARAGDNWLLVGRQGEKDLRVILDRTLEEQIEVPQGVPGEQWGYVFAATPGDTTTFVQMIVIQPGYGGDGQTIDGRWVLPTIGADPVPVGLSADRQTLVLAEAGVPRGAAGSDRTKSRFAILDANLFSRHAPRIVELPGAFDFDALSPDGSLLYVAEQIPGPLEGRYQVRAVETATGHLRPEVIVDKRNLDEQMAGYPIDQERRADGMVMTLYRGAQHPFVHALSSVDAWAVCIDLPTRGFDDEAAATDWGIADLGAGKGDVAVNATLGLAVRIHPTELTIVRSVDFKPSAAAAFRLAKFGHADLGPAGRRVVASPDGASVYAAGEGGVVRLGASDLAVERRYLTGYAIDAIAVTPDGTKLYALTRTGGRIASLDAATGELDGWVGDGGFDRLLGAMPW
jgi:hypothetical protein